MKKTSKVPTTSYSYDRGAKKKYQRGRLVILFAIELPFLVFMVWYLRVMGANKESLALCLLILVHAFGIALVFLKNAKAYCSNCRKPMTRVPDEVPKDQRELLDGLSAHSEMPERPRGLLGEPPRHRGDWGFLYIQPSVETGKLTLTRKLFVCRNCRRFFVLE